MYGEATSGVIGDRAKCPTAKAHQRFFQGGEPTKGVMEVVDDAEVTVTVDVENCDCVNSGLRAKGLDGHSRFAARSMVGTTYGVASTLAHWNSWACSLSDTAAAEGSRDEPTRRHTTSSVKELRRFISPASLYRRQRPSAPSEQRGASA
ncbi:uncharacterized protein [Dermacentor albipictus]|uniref:uncharacterized protein n=1 Tax=Dermacentor albipictus TaxID=60249 RepID=UPI0038FD2900